MSLKKFDTQQLKLFLQNITDIVDNDTISDEEIMLLCEFYYKFNLMKDNKLHTKQDILKYLSLGYYMYSFIEKE